MQFINLNITKQEKLVFNKPGNYVVFFHNLSGKFIFEIKERNVCLDIFGLFTGKGSDNFQVETQQYHMSPQSTSNLLIKGVFQDQSKFKLRGLIRIEKTAQNSHAYQKNKNLVLSESVFVDSKPELEILADEVYCTHGSSTGRLNENELKYLLARGVSRKYAEKLLREGFINDLIDLLNKKVNYPLQLSSYV